MAGIICFVVSQNSSPDGSDERAGGLFWSRWIVYHGRRGRVRQNYYMYGGGSSRFAQRSKKRRRHGLAPHKTDVAAGVRGSATAWANGFKRVNRGQRTNRPDLAPGTGLQARVTGCGTLWNYLLCFFAKVFYGIEMACIGTRFENVPRETKWRASGLGN